MSLSLLGHRVQLGFSCVVGQNICYGGCPYILRIKILMFE